MIKRLIQSGGVPNASSGVARKQDYLAKADRQRDAGHWAAAAELYAEYLTDRPDHAEIWVQLGNCAKEAGMYEQAMDAYGHALTLIPDSSDLHLQIGHLNKLTGNLSEALASYRKAAEYNPANADAKHEITALSSKIAHLPFLLPTSLFPGRTFASVEALLDHALSGAAAYDPFKKYDALMR